MNGALSPSPSELIFFFFSDTGTGILCLAQNHLEHCCQGGHLLMTPFYIMPHPIACLSFWYWSQLILTLSLVSHSELKGCPQHRTSLFDLQSKHNSLSLPSQLGNAPPKNPRLFCPPAPSINLPPLKYQKIFTGTKIIKVVAPLWPALSFSLCSTLCTAFCNFSKLGIGSCLPHTGSSPEVSAKQ